MKKMLSLVLALILCLTAVSAFAEAETPVSVELEAEVTVSPSLINQVMEVAETVEVPEELKDVLEVNSEEQAEETAAFVEDVLGTIAADIDTFCADVIPTEEDETLVLVATVPMSFKVSEGVKLEDLPEEIKIVSAIPENYPEDVEDIQAVYTYLTANGDVFSIVIAYEFDEEGNIVYTFPAEVVYDAQVGVMNFFKIVAEE